MPRFAANLTMLFNERPFLDRFEAAAAAGFKAVEFLFPYDFAPAQVADKLRSNGLQLVLHNLPAGNWAVGERGIACLPDRVEEFRARKGLLASGPNSVWGSSTAWPASRRRVWSRRVCAIPSSPISRSPRTS